MSITTTTLGQPTNDRAVTRTQWEGPLTHEDMDRIWALTGALLGARPSIPRENDDHYNHDMYRLLQDGAEALAQATFLYTSLRTAALTRGLMVSFGPPEADGRRTETRLHWDEVANTWALKPTKSDSFGPR